MGKWIFRTIIMSVVALGGYTAWDYYRAGLHTRPALAENQFSLSFASGLRVIMSDLPDLRSERVYGGLPAQSIPQWMIEAWSVCVENADGYQLPESFLKGHRIEAVCQLDVDGNLITTAFVTSRPKF